ncbi:MAG TPA: T9SS type A sorting domain-containing protein [Anaerolineales bacterium]|nr:T9SS type A sorting domain-containing protein [Anaerolineales bacterium]
MSANYQLTVSEKGSLSCNTYSKSFSIAAPSPLNISNLVTTDVSCFDGADGAMTFTGTGGSGFYNFKITKIAGDTSANTLGSFLNINAGDYKLVIENDLPGCQDKATYASTIEIKQPTEIVIGLTKNNISCFGYNDGSITSSVSGGTPLYTYTWEKQNGSFWSSIGSSPDLSNQSPGNFRLRITDNKTCVDVSDPVTIIEPSAISTQSISVNDIKCLGETGTITVQSNGGTLPYEFHYSSNNDSTFNPLLSGSTPLNAGSYRIKTTDKNGCAFTDPGTYAITAPPSALDFTFTKSDYNGYNISCLGGSNGFLKVLGMGGNGGTYSGYQFSYDNSSYATLDTIFNINAGNHNIAVKDNRGCIVSKNIPFTQTAVQLSVAVQSKQDVLCFGDVTGSVVLHGNGGVSPYTYSLNSSPLQTSPEFTDLSVGSFTYLISDKNNCTSTGADEIINLHPKMLFTSALTHVSCFDGADGSIVLNVTGGSSPFDFEWAGSTNTTSSLTNLGAGEYSVIITVEAGCKRDSSFTLTQPAAPLSVVLKTTPICYGETTGEIEAIVSGGTTPYQYSSDNGQTLQTGNIITALSVGTQTIYIVDQKGCTKTSTGIIEQRTDKPEPNFLVSTRQNALDTLIIKEISIPKPDSLTWTFDPAAIIIDEDPWSPQLKFSMAGTYYISMTGFFSGCDYSVEKTLALNPFDPSAPTQTEGYRPIESVDVSPNPGPGEFNLKVVLRKNYNLSVIVYDMMGVPHHENRYQLVKGVEQKINLTQASEGIYLIRVITDSDARDIRIIVQR